MFLTFDDGDVIDFDLQFLQELVGLLDVHIGQLESQATRIPDADAFGVFDSAEYIIGLGFVGCQGYLAATYGHLSVDKREALKVGPMHRCGKSFAELLNHAANFWKHHEEWVLHPDSAAQRRTLAGLAMLGEASSTDYPLSNALTALVFPRPARLQALLPHLEAWRDALAGAA